jgi:hypothetical protein
MKTSENTANSPRYAAFISYAHKDARWASWIQQAIETYRLPQEIAAKRGMDRKIGKVFRDRDELTVATNLGIRLNEALDNSDALIVVCSPNAAKSEWVAAEINYFKSLGKSDRIFCLLVGDPAHSFPEGVLYDNTGAPLEPLAADPREEADGKRLAKLKLIAGLTQLELDQLVRRDLMRERKRQSLYLSLAGVFLILAAGFFWTWQAQKREAASSLSLVKFVSSKWDQFREFGLPLDMIISLADEPLAYLKDRGTSRLDDEGKKAFAILLRQQGIAYMDQEDWETSLKLFRESSNLLAELSSAADDKQNLAYEIGLGQFWLGVNRFYVGDYKNAVDPIVAYTDTIQWLYNQNPSDPLYVKENMDSQTLLFELKRRAPGSLPSMSLDTQLQRVLDAANAGYEAFPESPNILEGFLTANSFAMEHFMASCSVDRALPLVENSYRAATLAAELEQQQYKVVGLERLKDWATNSSNLGNMYLNAGSIELAKRYFTESLLLRQRITTEDPTNEYAQKRLAESQLDLFRLSFLGPETFPTSPLDQSLLENISAAVKDELDGSLGLELARLQLLAENYVYRKDFLNAENLIIPLLEKLGAEDLSNERYAGYAAVAYWLSTAVEVTLDNPEFFVNSPIDNASSSCKGLFVQWSWHLANGNTDKADAIASELWSKGYKHPRMGFYARLAGATFPPAGISEQ